MRDFKSRDINVNGDFNVTDNSHQEHKLLIHCSSEELLRERPFREENVRIEQRRKTRRLYPLYSFVLLGILVAAGCAVIYGLQDWATVIIGGGSLMLGYLSLKATIEPNSFQIEEQDAVRQISKILRQRRVE